MKFEIDINAKQATTVPIRVRLIDDPPQTGVTMQVFVNNKWQPICTLRESGMLGLWDVKNEDLAGSGFKMAGQSYTWCHKCITTIVQ